MTDLKSTTHYQRQRFLAYDRDHGQCVRCLAPAGSIHHRQGRGGPDPHRLSNLISVCGDGTTGCHAWIHAHPEQSYEAGWMVRRHGTDRTDKTPVRYGDMKVTLTDEWTP